MMHRLLNVRVAGQQIQLIKLIGAFVMFAAILMFFLSAAQMFESWNNVKAVDNCLVIAKGDPDFFNTCQKMADQAFGLLIKADQTALNGKQLYIIIVKPIADLFIWIALLLFGALLYHTPYRVMLPVKQKKRIRGKR